ncbi:MotA/TolQ/ExbB proton channel family protein [Marinobacter sp. JSM 1782161]|uniref:MotA/TolQ/ExbB proton channel family protein n=1 Tax=Marinobacter sp. JSM 1782161 TaxID=2685906 RepID=UPI001402DADF|nr:MotA/TolQ/ExbB proton channel family protein [Marinobacter sp. JSM 1782161]
MPDLSSALIQPLAAFLNQGGPVMWVIALVTVLLWALILERAIYLLWPHRRFERQVLQLWASLPAADAWVRDRLRARLVSIVDQRLQRGIPMIRSLVAVCPLLGLLGTVTGMLVVFDVLAFTGTGNARAMADGVSRATLPTLAGMAVSLSGLITVMMLQRQIRVRRQRLDRRLAAGDLPPVHAAPEGVAHA